MSGRSKTREPNLSDELGLEVGEVGALVCELRDPL